MEDVTILVADDDRVTRKRTTYLLESWQYPVISVEDGQAAFDALYTSRNIGVAIIDWVMPVLTGPEVCSRFRAKRPDDPVYLMLLTVRGGPAQLVEGLKAGADDYLIKPVHDDILRARLDVGLRLNRAQKRAAQTARLTSAMEMAGAICHEINQPLQVVLGNSELISYTLDESDPSYESVHEIRKATERLGALTRKLMTLTRYETKPYIGRRRDIVDIEKSSNS